ncbi:FAD binding domain-containing protein [Rhodococcus sp. NPDC060086]|uniref:FAD binding domain-containing protein n=1 Tax=Rhodococcus sp. NPDC060086 TaxID=3347055 RepID=UPI003656B683
MQVPGPFGYERAVDVKHAIALLERLGEESRIIAGGHSLLPMMKLRLADPEHLIDINDLGDELAYIELEPEMARIGTLTRHRTLLESDDLEAVFPIFRDAEKVIADPVVRNRGTIGGSLCQADPAEDLSTVCSVLDATCVLRGPSGVRELSFADFHLGPYQTAVAPDELLVEVRLPRKGAGSSAYAKVERRAGDWAVAAAGAAVWMSGDAITDARVGLTAVRADAEALAAITDLLRGEAPSEELFREAGAIASAACSPESDQRGTAEYKRHLASELTVRTLRRAVARLGSLEGNRP